MTGRVWKQISKREWRCEPWTIALAFVDGCSLFILSKDGELEASAYLDDLEDAMMEARRLEGCEA